MVILSIFVSGFLIGALARWAVPGPDPMPIWLTFAIGMLGTGIGGSIALAALGWRTPHGGGDYFAVYLAEIFAATLVVVAYRRFVQKRPITGPAALQPPTRGWGLRRRMIIPRTKQEALKALDDLHDQGVLTEEEYVAKRAQVLRRDA